MNRGQLFTGAFLVFCGGALLLANVLRINPWAICCPVGVIFTGFVLLLPGTRRSWTSDDRHSG